MILVGVNTPEGIDEKWLNYFNDPSVVVLTETTSNIHHDKFFPCIDQFITPLTEDERTKLSPDILLTFGGLIVSKRIKALLRKNKPQQHWHIGVHYANDTFFSLNRHIKMTPNLFFEAFLTQVEPIEKATYYQTWGPVNKFRLERHNAYIKSIPYSDFLVFHHIIKGLPKNSNLQVANSSAIRYTQLFQIGKSINVFCNRGTSGIDGSTSTAIGYAVQSERPTILVTGDLSFFYDSHALWNNYIPKNFKIILLNNKGGGIFRILPGQKNTANFDTYFETTHQLTAEHICKTFGIGYRKADSEEGFQRELTSFYKSNAEPQLLEIFTPRTLNDSVLLDYFDFIK